MGYFKCTPNLYIFFELTFISLSHYLFFYE
jgi:hypothetical protein